MVEVAHLLKFNIFLVKRDIPSELESTRITPRGAERDISKVLDQSEQNLLDVSNDEVNETADDSSRIIRTRRKGNAVFNVATLRQ